MKGGWDFWEGILPSEPRARTQTLQTPPAARRQLKNTHRGRTRPAAPRKRTRCRANTRGGAQVRVRARLLGASFGGSSTTTSHASPRSSAARMNAATSSRKNAQRPPRPLAAALAAASSTAGADESTPERCGG